MSWCWEWLFCWSDICKSTLSLSSAGQLGPLMTWQHWLHWLWSQVRTSSHRKHQQRQELWSPQADSAAVAECQEQSDLTSKYILELIESRTKLKKWLGMNDDGARHWKMFLFNYFQKCLCKHHKPISIITRNDFLNFLSTNNVSAYERYPQMMIINHLN